jgi:tRNA-modifying protein YgfZ
MNVQPPTQINCEFALLDHMGMLEVTGADAASFLHGQLTQDVQSMDAQQARRAGYCNAKGRLYATLMLWRPDPECIMISLAANSSAFVAKRLSMFVLRAKAKVSDASAQFVQLGVWGAQAAHVLRAAALPAPTQHLGVLHFAQGWVTTIAPDRYFLCIQATQADALLQQLAQAGAQESTAAHWRMQDITHGIAMIDAHTQEQFVPQMINFELIGGVNFQKGCYPGQEVVARSQYLGKLKRRSAIAIAQAAGIASMDDVMSAGQPEPVGSVVNAQSVGSNTWVLFESTLAQQEAGGLQVNGTTLRLQPLPYALRDITE